MFDFLTERISSIFDRLRGKAFLNEDDITAVLREIRIVFLEADVSVSAARTFLDKVKEKALGYEIIKSVTPGQMMIKLIHEELISFLESKDPDGCELNTKANSPFAYMVVGLQGSGKTTTTAKLALQLKKKYKVLLVSLDVYRPAAQKQLQVLAEQIDVNCLPIAPEEKPLAIVKRAMSVAKKSGIDIVLFDTAGRTHIDDVMMDELKELNREISPLEILLVVDAMTGQDAVHIASSFKQALPITGLVFTRVDGDARGGAMLSMKTALDCPIKFLGVGEHNDQLISFDARRVADQILDRGDIVALVEKAEQALSSKESQKMQERLEKGLFNMNDMLFHLEQLGKMGGISGVVKFLPQAKQILKTMEQNQNSDGQNGMMAGDQQFLRQKALIQSMTPKERKNPDILNASRRRRIAKGAGCSVMELNKLLKQYQMIKDMTKKYAKGGIKGLAKLFNRRH